MADDTLSPNLEPNVLSESATNDRERKVLLGPAGGLVVFIFTAVALSDGVNLFRAASVSYTAFITAFTGVSSLTLVLFYRHVARPAARAAVAYFALIAWMLGSVLIDGTTRQGLQFIMVQIAFASSLLLASTARRMSGVRLELSVARCLRFTSASLIGFEILNASHLAFTAISARPPAIVSALCMGWFLAEFRVLGRRSSLLWSIAVLAGIGISLSRLALFAGFALLVATMLFAPGTRRLRNAILSILLVIAGIWAVTSWAPLRDRFTQGDLSLSVGGVKINAEGRTQVWDVLWSGVRQEPLIGHGPGAASARSILVEHSFDHPHNDYLLVLYDFGAIGIALLAWFLLRTLRSLRCGRRESRASIPALAALNAGLAVLVVMITDNPLDYPYVMIPLGALIGLGLGAMRSSNT